MDYLLTILLFILIILLSFTFYLNQTSEKEGIFTRRAWRSAGRSVSRTWRSASRGVSRFATRSYNWAKKRAEEVARKAAEYARKVKEAALAAYNFLKEQWEKLVKLAKMVIGFFKKVGKSLDPSPIFKAIADFGSKIAELARQLGDQIAKIAIVEVWIRKGINHIAKAIKKLEVVAEGVNNIRKEIEKLPQQFELLGRYIRSMGIEIAEFVQKIPGPLIKVGKKIGHEFEKVGNFFEDIFNVIVSLPKKAAREVGFIK